MQAKEHRVIFLAPMPRKTAPDPEEKLQRMLGYQRALADFARG